MTQYPARNTPTRLSAILDLPDRVRETFGAPFDVQLFVDDLTGSVLDDPVADPADLALVEIARTVLYAYKNPHALDDPRLATLGPLFDTVLDHFGPEEIEEILSYVVHALGEGSPIFGRVEGRAMAKAESLLQVLGHRMGSIPSATRERVLATSDEQLLERWFDRALTAGSVEEVFDWLDA